MDRIVGVTLMLMLLAGLGYTDVVIEPRDCSFSEILMDTYMCFDSTPGVWETSVVTGATLYEIITSFCLSFSSPELFCFFDKIDKCDNRLEIIQAFRRKMSLCEAANQWIKPYLSSRFGQLLVSPDCLSDMFVNWGQCRDDAQAEQPIGVDDDNFNNAIQLMSSHIELFVNCTLESDFSAQMMAEPSCDRFEPRDALLTMLLVKTFHENVGLTVDRYVIEAIMEMDNVRHDLLADLLDRKRNVGVSAIDEGRFNWF